MLIFGIWLSTALALANSNLADGDIAYKKRAEISQAMRALELYRKGVAESHERDVEALWRVAMACYFVGLRFEKSSERKIKYFDEGSRVGHVAIVLSPECAQCHFWTAINMALLGQERGAVKTLFMLHEIEEHLHTANLLDAKYAGAGSFRLLGLIQAALPGVLGGSDQQAKKFFELAIEEAPDEPLNYLFLAEHYRHRLKQPDLAKATMLRGVASGSALSEDRLESREALEKLKSLVAEPI